MEFNYRFFLIKNRDQQQGNVGELVEITPITHSFTLSSSKDNYSKKFGGKDYDVIDENDPINYVESIVIDTQGMKKTPSKGYKLGGLVEVKREFFAPLI